MGSASLPQLEPKESRWAKRRTKAVTWKRAMPRCAPEAERPQGSGYHRTRGQSSKTQLGKTTASDAVRMPALGASASAHR